MDGGSLRELAPADAAAYALLRPDQGEACARDRLARGYRCLGTWQQDQLVDAAWYTAGRGPVPYFHCDLELGAGDVYVFDSFTHPAFRGHNLYAHKVTDLVRRCREEGYRRSMALVAPENRTPLVILKRLKASILAEYAWAGVGPLHRAWLRKGSDSGLPTLVRGGLSDPACRRRRLARTP